MKQHGVNFYQLTWSVFGKAVPIWVAVSADGNIWVDPVGLGLRPGDVEPWRWKGPVALIDAEVNRIYVNARALVEMLPSPKDREGMEICMGRLEQLLRENHLLPNQDTARNN